MLLLQLHVERFVGQLKQRLRFTTPSAIEGCVPSNQETMRSLDPTNNRGSTYGHIFPASDPQQLLGNDTSQLPGSQAVAFFSMSAFCQVTDGGIICTAIHFSTLVKKVLFV